MFKRKDVKPINSLVISCFVALIIALRVCLIPAPIQANEITITEEKTGEYEIKFTVNTTYNDIFGFAVGNNEAIYAYLDANFQFDPILYGWQASFIYRNDSGAWDVYEPYLEPPTWVVLPDNYTTGFAFFDPTWWRPFDNFGPLEPGITEGFYGYLLGEPESAFCALRMTPEGGLVTITGETSVVPLPGAIWLLGSGFLGLGGLGWRRKRG